MENYINFENWLNNILKNNPMPPKTMAVNFNIYDNEKTYDVQIIGSSIYDENNDDWACEEIYSSGEDCFIINKTNKFDNNEDILENVEELVSKYINESKYGYKLKQYIAVCAGFVDGELDIVWSCEDEDIIE